MTNLFVSLLGALLATNQPLALAPASSKVVARDESVTHRNDPVEREYQKLLDLDDTTLDDVDKMIREEEVFAEKTAPSPEGGLRNRINSHFSPVRRAYEDFLKRHPDHARARLAYGSFLNDIKDEEGAYEQWEKARQLDPKNPAAWNNLANYYGHNGPITNSFIYYAKAIELNPTEPVYYHNFGTTVYLFRKDAMEHFNISEPQVFDKALALYGHALQLDPKNFLLASDIAQTFYGIRPLRTNAALLAWSYALTLARDEIEREGVYVHLARIKISSGRFDDARRDLDRATNAMYADLRKRVLHNLEFREAEVRGTNLPATKVETEVKPAATP